MQAVLLYIYSGETQVEEGDLDTFLALAEDLKIEGLVGAKKEGLTLKNDPLVKNDLNIDTEDENPDISDGTQEEKEKKPPFEIDSFSLKGSPIAVKTEPASKMNPVEGVSKVDNDKVSVFQESKIQTSSDDWNKIHVIKSQYKAKVINIIHQDHPLKCPSCNIGVSSKYYLQSHLAMKQEIQCKDCKLYFGSCSSMALHKRGRCRRKV